MDVAGPVLSGCLVVNGTGGVMNHCDTVGALTSVAVRDWRGSYSLGLRTLKARVACAGGLVNGDGNCAERYPALSLMLS